MRKWVLLLGLLLCLCGCARETLTDPVLFCESYNRAAAQPIRETDAYLRAENEVMLFAGTTLVRLKLNEDGAIRTAVVTGTASDETAAVCANAFAVLAQPFAESVPQTVAALCIKRELTVQTAQTKRFHYAVFCDGENVTAVQTNLLLSSLPDLPSLRPSGSE